MKDLKKRIISFMLMVAVMITGILSVPICAEASADVVVVYRTHVQNLGWQSYKTNGEMAGTSGRSWRLEGIEISLNQPISELGIAYTTHCQDYGWLPWSSNGEVNGTEGESKRLEAIKIRLTGSRASQYNVFYRVHAQNLGWLSWAANGEAAGTAGLSYRLEAIQIVVLEKGQSPANNFMGVRASKTIPYAAKAGVKNPEVPGENRTNIAYRTHVQNVGWQGWKYNGDMAGTSGRSLRLEGICIKLTNQRYYGTIVYRTHVQNIGWQNWKQSGQMSGTSGLSYRLEGIQIYLEGDIARHYDIYYRVHAQDYGWLGWAKNGEPSGTAGYAKRLEGIQIVLVDKNGAKPGNVQNLRSNRSEAFVCSSKSQIPNNPYVEVVNPAGNGSDNTVIVPNNTPSNVPSNVPGSGNTTPSGGSSTTPSGGTSTTPSGGSTKPSGGTTKPDPEETTVGIDATKYTYEIIPMLEPFNEYFYIKTENPDPATFEFVDPQTAYSSGAGVISPTGAQYADVKYENVDTRRVKGGYIARGQNTDGGQLYLMKGVPTNTYRNYNYETGQWETKVTYTKERTDIVYNVPKLVDTVDYLIDTYATGIADFHDRMNAIQTGLRSICLYGGNYVLGELVKSKTTPYWGISSSPHVDQNLYLQNPYDRMGNETLLASSLYPYCLDSLGFPAMLGKCARRMDSDAVAVNNPNNHYQIDITYQGVKKTYGGAGLGGANGILSSQINTWYSFDGSSTDANKDISMDNLFNVNAAYGRMSVPDEREEIVTWKDIRDLVGAGVYARIIDYRNYYGQESSAYTYLYDNGSKGTGDEFQAGGLIGYFSNAWFDGRYFDKYELLQTGVTFEDTISGVDEKSYPKLYFKDYKIKVPDNITNCEVDLNKSNTTRTKLSEYEGYDPETGTWYGYMEFKYYPAVHHWGASIYENLYVGSKYDKIEDPEFLDACTITLDEARAMGIDINTNKEPSMFLIFDMMSAPGTMGYVGN